MNTSPKIQSDSRIRSLSRRRGAQVGLVLVVAAGLAAGAYAAFFRNDRSGASLATAEVQRGALVISVAEAGTIQNRQRVIVKSEVEGSNTILSLVKEGVRVGKGELLIELDSSRLQDDKTQQQITFMNSEAGFIRARENSAVIKSQTDSDVAKADLTYKFAQQDLKKYSEGEHPRQLQQAEADINIAKEELQRAQDKLDWSKKLSDEGYLTRTELQADELAAKRAQISLELSKTAMDLLARYTHQRSLDQLSSDVEQAREALDRTKRKASADVVQAEADLKAKQSEYERQEAKLDKMDDQIGKCRIIAPVEGMVVYASTGQSGRRDMQPLDEGQAVRERQELIYLPTDAGMTAEIKIHEASLRKVKLDMPVRVSVDAVPGQVFWGRVSKIGFLPDGQSAWMNPDLKVYTTVVEIEGESGVLRPGMSCRAEVIVEQYCDALFVPVQSVVRVSGQPTVYVMTSQGPQPRKLEVGLDNNRMIRVVEGLTAGEKVLLAPPLAPSALGEGPTGQATTAPIPESLTQPSSRKAGPSGDRAGAGNGGGPTSRPGRPDMSRMRDMSPEERQKFLDSLTPEQREEMTRRGGGNRPRRPQPAQEAPQ